MPAGDPQTKPKISSHAIAALYLSISAFCLPIIATYLIRNSLASDLSLDAVRGKLQDLLDLITYLSVALLAACIWVGWKARKRIKRSHGGLKGIGRAWTGIIIGSLGGTFFFLLGPPPIGSAVAASQASAVGSLRCIHNATESYKATYHRGYPRHLMALGPPPSGKPQNAQGAGLIDETLASCAKRGYVFVYQVTAQDQDHRPSAYTVTAIPVAGCGKGGNCYYTDETGIIRQDSAHMPDKNSPRLAG